MEPVVIEITKKMKDCLWEKGARPFFAARRFYNPAVSQWCMYENTVLCKDDYVRLNENYSFGLSDYAKGIINKDFEKIFKGLESIYGALRFFKDFIFFNGTFRDTVFLVNPNGRILVTVTVKNSKKSKPLTLKFPQETPFDFKAVKKLPLIDDDSIELKVEPDKNETNVIGAVVLPVKYARQQHGLSIRHESSMGKRPRDFLLELFEGREEVKTKEIGSLGFTNPFSQIVTGNFEPEYLAAFKNARECLLGNNEAFNSAWRSIKKIRQSQKLPDINCPQCKILFTPKNKKQEYCSSKCRVYFYRQQKILSESKKLRNV